MSCSVEYADVFEAHACGHGLYQVLSPAKILELRCTHNDKLNMDNGIMWRRQAFESLRLFVTWDAVDTVEDLLIQTGCDPNEVVFHDESLYTYALPLGSECEHAAEMLRKYGGRIESMTADPWKVCGGDKP